MQVRRIKKIVVAKTTEDRLWDFIGEQSEILSTLANSEDLDNERKKQLAGAPYNKLRNALRQLGALF